MADPNLRSFVYQGLIEFFKRDLYFRQFLEEKGSHLSSKDWSLALEIGQGVIKRYRCLQRISKQLMGTQKLQAKREEKLLFFLALYQWYFLDRIPLHAIVNETVAIAKAHRMHYFARFLNAFLRKLPLKFDLPTPKNERELAETLSYPNYIVQYLTQVFGPEKARTILEIGNAPPATFLRIRPGFSKPEGYDWHSEPFCKIKSRADLTTFSQEKAYYIQNPTAYSLLQEMLPHLKAPKHVLDLCAAPGGKSLALWDLLDQKPSFTLNDPSSQRSIKLKENMEKYGLQATYMECDARDLDLEPIYDCVIADIPCSNTGTLSRKAEARWRLERDPIQHLCEMGRDILASATRLCRPGGQIFYMTCSILPEENEDAVEEALRTLPLKKVSSFQTVLPNQQGWDGGFCALLERV